ncbi:MAG: hypothetical protein KatS3mg129_1217 [Leptospiraceae bacterium]|nr:MAG: hypothetical protein KatS3mg129_1217 [Leptospiraceae bacterium]
MRSIKILIIIFLFINTIWGLPKNYQIVEAKYVCMTQDKVFDKELLPVSINGKTYYGCCGGCVLAMKENPSKYIYAIDPITKERINKADSIILNANGYAIYFKNKDSLNKYLIKLRNQ